MGKLSMQLGGKNVYVCLLYTDAEIHLFAAAWQLSVSFGQVLCYSQNWSTNQCHLLQLP